MPGSDPNEEGLRAIGRAIDESSRPRPSATGRGRRAPAHAGPGRGGDGARGTGVTRSGGDRNGGGGTRSGGDRNGGGGGTRGGDAERRRPKRRRWLRRTLISVAALVLCIIGAGVGYGIYLNHEVNRVPVSGLTSGSTNGGADTGTENILMVGSTTRCGLAKQTPAYGLCTQGVTGVNSDVVMILHLNPANKTVSVLSLPRDLFVPNARSTGAYKIDAALAQGPSQLVAVIEEDFAIPIQHYVELNFDTFAAVVTALGGITMEFPDRVFDRYSGLRVFSTGCHHLNGVQALQVVRARHLQYWVTGDTPSTPYGWPQEALSDLARIRRDHEFLRVLASEVSKRGLGNPGTDLSLINAVAPHLTVDSGLSASGMVNLVLSFHSVNVNNAPQLTLPVRVDTFGTYTYEGGHYGTIEFPTTAQDHSVIDQFLGLAPDANTMTGKPLPPPSSVTVSVLNGTGTYNQATQTATALGKLGFHVVGTGTTTVVAQQEETRVTYSSRTPSVVAAAQLVADSISGSVVLDYGKTTDGAQVTVTTGTNFSVNPSVPSSASSGKVKATTTTTTTAASTSSGTSGSTTTTTTSGSTATSTSNFTPASAAVTPLKSWDPRACPAGQTGNAGNW